MGFLVFLRFFIAFGFLSVQGACFLSRDRGAFWPLDWLVSYVGGGSGNHG